MAVRWRTIGSNSNTTVEEIHTVVVYRFTVGDVLDRSRYAVDTLLQWEQSEPGQFVMKHAIDKPGCYRPWEISNYKSSYAIIAELEMTKLSEFYLKWGQNGSNTV